MRRAATWESENTRVEAMLEARQVGPGLVRGAGARSVKIKSSSIRGIRDTDESRLMVRRFRIKLKGGYRYLYLNPNILLIKINIFV